MSNRRFSAGAAGRRAVVLARGGSDVYLIAGLIAIIVVAVAISTYYLTSGGPGSADTEGTHFWCQEAGKEIVLKASQIPPGDAERLFGDASVRVAHPETGRRTLVLMWRCPKCREYFLPEALKKPGAQPPRPTDPSVRPTCPHCGENVPDRRAGRRE